MGTAADFLRRLLQDEAFPDALASQVSSVDDPISGHVEREELRAFALQRRDWFRERGAKLEPLRVTRAGHREVAEAILRLQLAASVELPVAVASDESRQLLRVYFSRWRLEGHHRVRDPLLAEDPTIELSDVVRRYQRALAAGDVDQVVSCFEPDGYAREPAGGEYVHRGTAALRAFYAALFRSGGGIPLEHCTATDDGVACALEYNAVRWGRNQLPPQAGIAVYERGASGLLTAARIYDDVNPPAPDS